MVIKNLGQHCDIYWLFRLLVLRSIFTVFLNGSKRLARFSVSMYTWGSPPDERIHHLTIIRNIEVMSFGSHDFQRIVLEIAVKDSRFSRSHRTMDKGRKDHVQSHRLALSPSFHFRGVLVTHCCQHPADKYNHFSDLRSVLVYLSIQHGKNGTMRTTSAAVFVSTFHVESVADVEQSPSPRIIETRREGACAT